MSEPAGEPRNSEDISELREELRALASAVNSLAARVELLEGDREVGEAQSLTYSVVSPVASQAAGLSHSSGSVGYTQSVILPKAKAAPPIVQSWAVREEIAAEVGRWLRLSLEGGHRGNSGRDRILLSSRLYIVVRDHSGLVRTDPVRIFSRFADVRAICFRGHWGDSIFVGLPSQREISVCLRAGRFSGPSQIP